MMSSTKTLRFTLGLFAVLAIGVPGSARAVVTPPGPLYSTLTAPRLAQGFTVGSYDGAAFSFQTTATGYVIDTVKVQLKNNDAASGQIDVAIYDASGASGAPGTIVGTAVGTVPAGTLTSTYQTFTFSSLNRTLAPSTNYWVVISSTGLSSASPFDPTSPASASVARTNDTFGEVTTGSNGSSTLYTPLGWSPPSTSYYVIGAVIPASPTPTPTPPPATPTPGPTATPTPVATATPTPPPGPTPTPGSSNLAACAITPSTIGLCPGASVPTSVTVSPDPATVDFCASSNGVSVGCVTTSVAAGPFVPISYDNLVSQGLAEGDFYALSLSAPGSPSAKCSLSVTLLPSSDPSCGDLVDTDVIDEPFVQLNDRPVSKSQGPVDTFTIRGRVYFAQGEDPIGSALANGVTSTVYQTGSATGSFVGYAQVDTFTWDASQCKGTHSGLSVYCKDPVSGSFLRLRGTQAKPTSLRVNTVVKHRDFIPGKPFTVPLAGEVTITNASPSVGPANFDWDGFPEVTYCNVSHNGERTTCRQPKAGPG